MLTLILLLDALRHLVCVIRHSHLLVDLFKQGLVLGHFLLESFDLRLGLDVLLDIDQHLSLNVAGDKDAGLLIA